MKTATQNDKNKKTKENMIKRLKLLKKEERKKNIVVSSAGAGQPSILRCHWNMWYGLGIAYQSNISFIDGKTIIYR